MDLTFMEKYCHISTHGAENPVYSVSVADLMDPAIMRDLLERGGALVKAIGMELAVSFIGLAAFGLPSTKQLMMSQYNRVLDLSPSNVTVQLVMHNDYAQVVFKLHELKWTELPETPCERNAAVIAEWERYFRLEFNPLIERIASAGGMKPDLIWNQFGTRIAFMMDSIRENTPQGPKLQRIEEDFALLAGLPPKTFNRRRKNPFDHTPVYVDSPYKPGTQTMIRSACCMYYRRENGVKCYNCPILKESERAERKAEIEALLARQA
ncbi:(2Fe-2S)-binding protein [Cohnella yongneupensis]|uniref:(2Fe-2S)-binding protein n=1 Tax=Cohnella yongneupensis TaxID=425006 RepID=A0ABW0QXB1_9BACL